MRIRATTLAMAGFLALGFICAFPSWTMNSQLAPNQQSAVLLPLSKLIPLLQDIKIEGKGREIVDIAVSANNNFEETFGISLSKFSSISSAMFPDISSATFNSLEITILKNGSEEQINFIHCGLLIYFLFQKNTDLSKWRSKKYPIEVIRYLIVNSYYLLLNTAKKDLVFDIYANDPSWLPESSNDKKTNFLRIFLRIADHVGNSIDLDRSHNRPGSRLNQLQALVYFILNSVRGTMPTSSITTLFGISAMSFNKPSQELRENVEKFLIDNRVTLKKDCGKVVFREAFRRMKMLPRKTPTAEFKRLYLRKPTPAPDVPPFTFAGFPPPTIVPYVVQQISPVPILATHQPHPQRVIPPTRSVADYPLDPVVEKIGELEEDEPLDLNYPALPTNSEPSHKRTRDDDYDHHVDEQQVTDAPPESQKKRRKREEDFSWLTEEIKSCSITVKMIYKGWPGDVVFNTLSRCDDPTKCTINDNTISTLVVMVGFKKYDLFNDFLHNKTFKDCGLNALCSEGTTVRVVIFKYFVSKDETKSRALKLLGDGCFYGDSNEQSLLKKIFFETVFENKIDKGLLVDYFDLDNTQNPYLQIDKELKWKIFISLFQSNEPQTAFTLLEKPNFVGDNVSEKELKKHIFMSLLKPNESQTAFELLANPNFLGDNDSEIVTAIAISVLNCPEPDYEIFQKLLDTGKVDLDVSIPF